MLLRVEKPKGYRQEPAIWCDLLTPIFKRFVLSMNDPGAEEMLDFWQRIVHYYNMSSEPTYFSVWITAFYLRDEDGKLMSSDPSPRAGYHEQFNPNFRLYNQKTFDEKYPGKKDLQKSWNELKYPYLVLDGARYGRLDSNSILPGYGPVRVHGDDEGHEFDTVIIAGSLGITGSSSGRLLENGEPGLDTSQPVAGWLTFEK